MVRSVPAGRTPRDIVDRLRRETAKALRIPSCVSELATLGVEPMVMTGGEFEAQVEKELAINAALVKAVGLSSK